MTKQCPLCQELLPTARYKMALHLQNCSESELRVLTAEIPEEIAQPPVSLQAATKKSEIQSPFPWLSQFSYPSYPSYPFFLPSMQQSNSINLV